MDFDKYSSKHTNIYTNYIPQLLKDCLTKNNWDCFCDLGCGDGSLLNALNKKNYFTNKTVYAIDLSNIRLKNVIKINPKFKCYVNDVCNIESVSDNTIDIVVSMQVVEHVSDNKKMIQEINRIMKTNGIAYITTVYKKWYGWYFYRNNGKWVLDPTHVIEYTDEKQLLDLFKDQFEIIENKKSLIKYPIIDVLIRKFGLEKNAYKNKFVEKARLIKIFIPGYYNWELALRKIN